MDDTLPPIRHTEVGEAKRLHIFLEGGTLRPRVGLRNKICDSGEVFARGGTVRRIESELVPMRSAR